jgi:DNA ligase-1
MDFPVLYKKAANGKISSWRVFTNLDEVVIEHGYTDGIKQTEIIEATEKNVGRSNETSGPEQAELEAKARWLKQRDQRGYTENITGITKMDVYLPMLAQKYTERAKYIKLPCLIQPKLNGSRCISYIKDGKRVYQSRLGKLWTTLDHLTKDLRAFDGVILDGEIYYHGIALQDISSLVKNQDPNHSVDGLRASDLEYWVYDVINSEKQGDRRRTLSALFQYEKKIGNVVWVPTGVVDSDEEIREDFDTYIEEGYEGAILRNDDGYYALNKRSNDLQKVKLKLDDEFEIVGGYEVATGREQGTCVFTCKTKEGLTFDVRPKGSVARRKQYWKDLHKLRGLKLTVEFQEWTSEKKPFHARGVCIRDYE